MRRSWLAAAGVLILGLAVQVEAAHVIKKIPYSKTTGLEYPARYTFRFSLWTSASGGSGPVWSEEKQLRMTGKKVRTLLGSAESLDGVSFEEQLWVQVERKIGSNYREVGGRTMLRVVPYALWSGSLMGGSAVPVGTVIDWWQPNDTWPVPEGYAICDGTVLDDPASLLHGEQLPDLRNKYIMGASSAASIGSTTGGNLHDHSTNLSHNHGAFSSGGGGSHLHAWLQWYGGVTTQFDTWNSGGSPILATSWDNGIDSAGSGIYPLSIMDPVPNQTWFTEPVSSHTHAVDPPSLGDVFRVSSAGSSVPPSVLLLKIMRVR